MSNPLLTSFLLPLSAVIVSPIAIVQRYEPVFPHNEAFAIASVEVSCTRAVECARLGSELRSRGRLEEAIAAYQRAIELDANIDDDIYNNLGVTLHELGTVLTEQGHIEDAQERFSSAEQIYQRAIELNPTASKYINLGITLRDLDRRDEAIAALQTAISLAPDYAAAYYTLGIVLEETGRDAEAEEAYHTAHDLDPRYSLEP